MVEEELAVDCSEESAGRPFRRDCCPGPGHLAGHWPGRKWKSMSKGARIASARLGSWTG